jgi:uncharacterized protein YihD (DUF1040 family)
MKRKEFILSNGMFSTVKIRVYSSVSTIKMMLMLLAITVTGCQKNSNLPDEFSQLSVIDEDRMNIIAALSKDYENTIKEALSERIQVRSNGVVSNVFDINERIGTIYQEKCNQYDSSSKITLRSETEESMIDLDVLQIQLDRLQESWDIVIQNSEDDNKEDFITKIQKVSSDLELSVLSDNSLNDIEKQIIYENIVFRTNIVVITLQYGEDIQDFVTTRGLFSWVKKNLKKIECTAKSVGAAATCAAAAVSTVTGPAAIAAWAGCVAATSSAAACWASL